MRRHIIMGSAGRKEYFQDMYPDGWNSRMKLVVFYLKSRHPHIGNRTIGAFRVKELKQKAFETPSIIPGTFKSWEENKHAK